MEKVSLGAWVEGKRLSKLINSPPLIFARVFWSTGTVREEIGSPPSRGKSEFALFK